MAILGIDYASIDGLPPPLFSQTKAGGYSFVYLRGTWGTWADPVLARDRAAAAKAGLTVGVYLALRFPELGHDVPPPGAQVKAFGQAYQERGVGELPVALDVEFPGRGIVDTGMGPKEALEWLSTAVEDLLVSYGPHVVIYTSARVWHEDLQDIAAPALEPQPLWCKTPYLYQPRQAAHPGAVSQLTIPNPWHNAAWIQQFQGDALGVPGVGPGTVDLNKWLSYTGDPRDPRAAWVADELRRWGALTVEEFQRGEGLTIDGVIGPKTFAALTRWP